MLLYRRRGGLVLPLTRRTDKLQMHKGQISLPGGAREPQDPTFVQTALRETGEELGIPAGAVDVLGPLTPLFIPVSAFCVYPYVGYARQAVPLQPDANEVAEVIGCRLSTCWTPRPARKKSTGVTISVLKCPPIGSGTTASGERQR